VFWLMCGIPIMSTYGEMKIFAQFDVYMLLLFFSFSYIMIDIGLHMVNGEIRAYMQVKREEMALLKKKKIKLDDTLDQERYSNVAHTGYAFSGAEGNSTLVTDNLSNRLKEAMFKQFYGKIFDPNLAPVENPPTT